MIRRPRQRSGGRPRLRDCRAEGQTEKVPVISVERSMAESPRAVMLPTPPALATATASPEVDTEPIGACCIGTRQPVNSVNRVVTVMIATRHALTAPIDAELVTARMWRPDISMADFLLPYRA
jgi:hypothetical protein